MLNEQVELSLPNSPMQSRMFLSSFFRGTEPREATAAAQTHTAQKRKSQCWGLRITHLSSKGAHPRFLLPRHCTSHPRVFRDPGPLERGRSLRASQAEHTQIQSIYWLTSNKQLRKSGNIILPQQTTEPAGRGRGECDQPGKLKTDPNLQPKANGNIRSHSAGSPRTMRGTEPERQAEGYCWPHGHPFA